ncbi:MAG: hypothetical protein KAW42_05695 [Candidatus Atribacteria bacterium]|nr:hypothetical protein [Candidatus Atribacteria bacterium]
MKRLTKYMGLVIILLLAVALMTGCTLLTVGKVTGGGWFDCERTESKCTFGFNAQGDGDWCEGMEFKGQFQFNDHVDTKIHVQVMKLYEYIFEDNTYKFAGDTKDGDEVVVTVVDNGQPGADEGDQIRIKYQGKTWEGELGGGNIQVH